MLPLFRSLLPDRPVRMRVVRGPFRGARIVANPRTSLRKVFGLYEHELNDWLAAAIPRVSRLLDVGANDGYFTLGCAAAFRRAGTAGEIICFEPQSRHVSELQSAIAAAPAGVRIRIVPSMVGRECSNGMTTLDALTTSDRRSTLIKIDVEGAELDVIAGAASWLHPSNVFVIEVHQDSYLAELKKIFDGRGLRLRQVDQQPLPILGREARSEANWWLVSDLS